MRGRLGFASARLSEARAAGLGRSLRPSRVAGSRIIIGGKSMVNLCSNDYLGIPPSVGACAIGQVQSASRLLGGSDESLHELEAELAGRKGRQAALVFPTGYMANAGAISALAGPGDLILSDRLNHASIVDACRASGAAVSVYGHNDMADLGKKIRAAGRRKFVITEGIFSMDGDRADLAGISEAASRHGAITVLDDAHADFAVGPDGRGSLTGRAGSRVDVYVSSLSKALGSFGGYASAGRAAVSLLASTARPFVYTSALPSHMARHALARIRRGGRAARQKRLASNVRAFSRGLASLGYEVPARPSHIIPVMVGPERGAAEFSRRLESAGAYAQAVRYPTVPKGQARIRVSVTARMSSSEISAALGAMGDAGRAMRLI